VGSITGAGEGLEPLVDRLASGRPLVRVLDFEGIRSLGVPAPAFDAQTTCGRSARRMSRAAQFAAGAGQAALDRADAGEFYEPSRCAVVEATSAGGLAESVAHVSPAGPRSRGGGPRVITTAMNGGAGSYLCARYRIRGPALALSNGSCSSASALGVGCDLIRSGSADLVVVTAGEAPLFDEMVTMFTAARIGSRNTCDPQRACRPFDRDRDGTVLAEAGAAVVLESARAARARGARPVGYVAAVEQTSDGVSGVRPAVSTGERARAIRGALERAGAVAADVDWVCAHGTATRINDPHEAEALRSALGRDVESIPVTGMKSTLGHALGACSLLELVACVGCMGRDLIPPTAALENVAEDCRLRHVIGKPLSQRVQLALLNSASFGGRNTTIALQAA
jgi:3-oxoacyl-(acyl-carrier-protein) synthase